MSIGSRFGEGALPEGAATMTAGDAERPITVFTYRPPGVTPRGVLVMFDGIRRNAEGMRDRSIELAKRSRLAIVAPLMNRERFPRWRYDLAGVVKSGHFMPAERWTAPILQRLIERAQRQLGRPPAPVYLFGHSAGGQMLSRVCAYSPLSEIARVVIANPSAYVAPTIDEAAPYGFGSLFERRSEAIARIQVYLAQPITIYLGDQDTGARNLARSQPAMCQGEHRLERGRNVFGAARKLAARKGWAFNWRRVEAAGVGHSSRSMLHDDGFAEALGLVRGRRLARAAVSRAKRRPEKSA